MLCLALQFLACGTEEDFVHVHLVRLAHGEDHCPREGIDRNRELVIELAHIRGDLWLGDGVRQFRDYRARRSDFALGEIARLMVMRTGRSAVGKRVARQL
jgi:hypothetical protein